MKEELFFPFFFFRFVSFQRVKSVRRHFYKRERERELICFSKVNTLVFSVFLFFFFCFFFFFLSMTLVFFEQQQQQRRR